MLPAAALFGALAVGYGLTASTSTPTTAPDRGGPRRGPADPRRPQDWLDRLAADDRSSAIVAARLPAHLDDRHRRRPVLGAAGRRPARRRADAHLRDAGPRARLRPLPLERGRGLRAGAPAHPPRRRRPAGRPRQPAARLRQLYLLLSPASASRSRATAYIVLRRGALRRARRAIALAIGAFLDEALEGSRSEPVAGLLMATGTMVVARDFFLAPEELASVHLFDKVHWPPHDRRSAISSWASASWRRCGVYAGLAARGRALGHVAAADPPSAPGAPQPLDRALIGLRALRPAGRRSRVAVVFAFYLAQGLVPTLSTHLSFKPVLESYAKFAQRRREDRPLPRRGARLGLLQRGDTMVDLPNQEQLVAVPARSGAGLRAGLGRRAGARSTPRSSRRQGALLRRRRVVVALPADLEPARARARRDQNPLRKDVWMAPTPPSGRTARGSANEKPPWKWRVPSRRRSATPSSWSAPTSRPDRAPAGQDPARPLFRVKARPPAGYKIFVHFDGPAAPRVIGDHDPVNHAFGTAYWLPGEYIRDHYETDVPLMTTPAGHVHRAHGLLAGRRGQAAQGHARPQRRQRSRSARDASRSNRRLRPLWCSRRRREGKIDGGAR